MDEVEHQIWVVFGTVTPAYVVTLEGAPMPPGGQFLLGTDTLGRDLLSRMLYGARTSLGISFGSCSFQEPVDGLPFIGELVENQFGATGFAGNGTVSVTSMFLQISNWQA